ncbi:hypothetical protein GEMRC1_014207 [Eukaryota sp. GEM-RC1]
MFLPFVILTCLFICSINGFSPTIFFSDPVPLEFELPQMTSDRIVSTVIANVDGNDDPDAIIFYAMSTTTTQTRIKWHVVTSGASERIQSSANSWTQSYLLTQRRQPSLNHYSCSYSCGCGIYGCSTCWSSLTLFAHFQRNFAFASAQLNNNNLADVVMISADFDGHRDGYTTCPFRYQYHITWRVVVFRDFTQDGRVSTIRTSDGFSTGVTEWQSARTGDFPTALRVETDSSVCSGQSNHPHLATFLIRRARIHLCINAEAGSVFISSQNRYLPTSADAFATSTFFKVNSLWYSLIMNKNKQYFILPDSTSNSLTTRTLGTPATDSYMGIGAYDFNGDGVDDLWMLECPETGKCQYRHGIIYDPSIDSTGADSNYVNQYL